MSETGRIDMNRYLTFKLDEEVFGLAIGKVQGSDSQLKAAY